MLKVDSKYTRTIVNLEHVIAGWVCVKSVQLDK